MCNLYEGLLRPTPTLPVNSPIARVPLALARIIGIPEISLTENIVPEERLLFIENNCPELPSKDKVLSDKISLILKGKWLLLLKFRNYVRKHFWKEI